jgi:hypothetical protein
MPCIVAVHTAGQQRTFLVRIVVRESVIALWDTVKWIVNCILRWFFRWPDETLTGGWLVSKLVGWARWAAWRLPTVIQIVGAIFVAWFLLHPHIVIKQHGLIPRIELDGAFCAIVGAILASVGYFVMVQMRRWVYIPRAEVFDRTLTKVLRSGRVAEALRTKSPKLGHFRAVGRTGGFSSPFPPRKVLSGEYSWRDLFGLRPQSMQLIFVLENKPERLRGTVYAEVSRPYNVQLLEQSFQYKSLAVTVERFPDGDTMAARRAEVGAALNPDWFKVDEVCRVVLEGCSDDVKFPPFLDPDTPIVVQERRVDQRQPPGTTCDSCGTGHEHEF